MQMPINILYQQLSYFVYDNSKYGMMESALVHGAYPV